MPVLPAPLPLPAAGKRRRRDGAPCAAEFHADFLSVLGERVRAARVRRGMTRKILARDSAVSERYLAQLEAGQGNISIGLLRQIADAMSLPLGELVREGEERPIELTLLIQRLERLPPAELAEAARLLNQRFGLDRGALRRDRIALIGLRGAGKSTLGRKLAAALDRPFIELADEIAAMAGMSLDQIFDLSGQAGYRRYERRALERVLERHDRFVLATGGSLVSEAGTYDLLLGSCFTVWIKAAPEEHMARVVAQGDTRPMAGNAEAMDDLRQILAEREALYARADAALDTGGKSQDAAFSELSQLVQRKTAVSAK
ncbi:MAG: helix-turn-helix transcriptional regulator [Rhodospirillaceae bacterium]|nr:helix-turn-helix transcriptional regulator [Rhodospirillaceae bacterium]